MTQRAVSFGPGDALVGVFTSPAEVRADAPVVLLTNAGVLPRQGPHRLNVRIARALANVGLPSLRMDLSGQGDSRSAGTAAGYRAQAVADLQSGMDWVQRSTGAKRFLIFGICSGAVNAHDLALADERVAGVLMFDGFWYRSRWTIPVRNFKRASAVGWQERIAAIRRRVSGEMGSGSAMPAAPAIMLANSGDSGNPPLSTFVQSMQRLVDRGADVYFVYSGSVIDFYSYSRQFKDVFGGYPFFPHVRCEYYPDIDHTFVTRHAQLRMLDLIRGWALGQMSERSTARQPR